MHVNDSTLSPIVYFSRKKYWWCIIFGKTYLWTADLRTGIGLCLKHVRKSSGSPQNLWLCLGHLWTSWHSQDKNLTLVTQNNLAGIRMPFFNAVLFLISINIRRALSSVCCPCKGIWGQFLTFSFCCTSGLLHDILNKGLILPTGGWNNFETVW